MIYSGIEVVVIDDGSTDDTDKVAAAESATVLKHVFNQGYGTAIQTGYKYALEQGYEYLIQLDADGQHDPSSIGALLEPIHLQETEITLGSRFLGTCNYQPSKMRMLGIYFFRFLIRVLIGKAITDPTTGFQAMNRRVLSYFVKDTFPTDYPDADVIIFLHLNDVNFKEIPVTMYADHGSKSMHEGFFSSLYYIFKLTTSAILMRFRPID